MRSKARVAVSPPAATPTDSDWTPRLRPLDSTAADADTVTMPATFLQFCAMCEKQITHPSTKILYCSEACRKKDDAKPLSASTLPSSYLSSGDTSTSSPPRSTSLFHEAVAAAPYSPTPSIRIPADEHTFKPDLDPTEWKPKLSGSGSLPRTHSDAYRYLSRFHVDNTNAVNPSGNEYVRVDRPSSSSAAQRRKHTSMHMHTKSLTTTTPSLASTPTTAASSLSSTASASVMASRSLDVRYDCDFPTRPLNSRTNPLYAISPAAKSTDLVTPHIVPALGSGAGDMMTWEKKPISEPGVKQSALSKEFL